MQSFDFHPRTRLVFGPDKIDELGTLAAELNCRRAMVVSDPGIEQAGHDDRGLEALHKAGLEAVLYDDVVPNPTTENVDHGVAFAKDFRPDLLVGLGGGSSMDAAKGINFLYTNGGRMEDYWGVGKATKPMLPMIAVPTTAGTGSEAQSFALISDPQTHVKMACGDKKAACKIALLDPKLTLTQPAKVTALTGIDAISHAVETYVTRPRTAVSVVFSREAWRLLEGNFERVIENPDDLEARGGMQLGAFFAGLAIENSMLGAAHSLANPLTQHFGIIHGQAVAFMLPHVVRFNGEAVGDLYAQLVQVAAARSGGRITGGGNGPGPADLLAEHLARLVEKSGLAARLSACGVAPDRLRELAAGAAGQWTAQFNPQQAGEAEMLALYRAAL